MGYSDLTETDLVNIRNAFLQKYSTKVQNGSYHDADVERIKAGTDWIRACYKHSSDSADRTLNTIDEVLTWRKEFEANELLRKDGLAFPNEFFELGSVFVRNEDINCNPILHFVVKLHKKNQYPHQQVCKFIAFHFERLYKFNVDDPIVILFDMYEAGYSNLDMDFIKFVVNCLKTYYPGLIDYMVIFQMPFIFNAAWKIIKNWLPPESVKLIKFVDKKSIREFIQESQLFVHMGGTDNYKYVYNPDEYSKRRKSQSELMFTPQTAIKTSASSTSNTLKSQRINFDLDEEKPEKTRQNEQVAHSASFVSTATRTQTMESIVMPEESSTSVSSVSIVSPLNGKEKRSSGDKSQVETLKPTEMNPENTLKTDLLSINPGDELVFNVTDAKSDITQYIRLANNSSSYLAYKIKITSPDKFRVKPGTGVIESGGNAQIMINFLKEFQNAVSNHKDKFLILWTSIDEKLNQNELNEFWKQLILKKGNVNEHKVKCVISRGKEAPTKLKEITSASTALTSTPLVHNSQSSSTVNDKFKSVPSFADEKAQTVSAAKSSTNSKLEKIYSTDLNSVKSHEQLVFAKLNCIEANLDSIANNQQKINKQYSILIFLVYFLIILNVIQLIFQSNLFTQVVEPYIDYMLFQKNEE